MAAGQQFGDIERAAELAVHTADRWTQLATEYPTASAAKLLSDVLDDPSGLGFTVEFVDGVIRPEDPKVAARNLSSLMKKSPDFLPTWLRLPARIGGKAALAAPELVVAAARRVFWELVSGLVLDARDEKLGAAIAKLRENGSRLNLNLLGEAVLGEAEATKRLSETFRLLQRDDVDYVSLKVSSVIGPHSPWDHEKAVEVAVAKLLPLYQYAAAQPTDKFINLDMEEYRDLDLTLDVFERLLDREELLGLEAGIVIQAYLPDGLAAMKRLQEWAADRRARGGAPIKVRLVKGANLAMEQVDAEQHGWPLTTWESKKATDANYLRILDWSLTPERVENIKVGVAGHNLFSLATAWELAGIRGVREGMDIEMLVGMADSQAGAIRAEVGDVLLYVPVVQPSEFDVAIAYLVRRLEEGASEQNFMASIFDLATDQRAFDKEKARFDAAMKMVVSEGEKRCHPSRTQNRAKETTRQLEATMRAPGGGWRFHNTPDTDPALPANRQWIEQIAARIPTSDLGVATVKASTVVSVAELEKVLAKAAKAQKKWEKKTAAERADILHRAGVELAHRRGDLIEVAGAEVGKAVGESDVEVSEAVDFAHYYAQQGLALEQIHGATFKPVGVTAVIPPWNFPVAIPLGGVAASLSAGSAAVLKPASVSARCGAVLMECLWKAGVPKDLAPLVIPGNREVARALVEADGVERVVLTGSSQTAQMFLDWKPSMGLMGETSGKNSIIITPSADYDLAIRDVIKSAFGHAGQKCSAASLLILVGSAGMSRRIHDQLVDATSSLVVDWPTNLSTEMDTLTTVPGEKLRRGLTTLESGQSWVLKPYPLDDTDRLWAPGIRAGVKPGSEFHQVEYFGPLLGVIRVKTLEEAIEVQNGTEYGLTAGLHSLSSSEIRFWLDRVQAGNAYVNRGITGAIVQRQPFGGWKQSSVGATCKAGGPNYLYGFGSLVPEEISVEAVAPLAGNRADIDPHITKPQLLALVDAAKQTLPEEDLVRVIRAAYNAEQHLDRLSDPSALVSERNVLRYLPAPSTLRVEDGVSLGDILTVAAAAVAVGSFEFDNRAGRLVRVAPGQSPEYAVNTPLVTLSSTRVLPAEVAEWAETYGFTLRTESHEEFLTRIALDEGRPEDAEIRIRALGTTRAEIQEQLGADLRVAVWDGPATVAARVEALPFLHEQAVSISNHRYGNPTSITEGVLAES
ncbi:proline dehydrogenase family protein [Actinomyces minihominis]|uniref:proline dehydrogenase family protein n=1 Tax=Actinomyces minihominis TaxID=2002838 RepID=UPI000C071EA4|nr:bifunctional proline dehydrogenase/L-glutamate gamma-semialdehyde dehydrogenase [Actinomyces minihominis]